MQAVKVFCSLNLKRNPVNHNFTLGPPIQLEIEGKKKLIHKSFQIYLKREQCLQNYCPGKKAKKMKKKILMKVFRSTSRGNSVSKTTVLENADDSEICFRAK